MIVLAIDGPTDRNGCRFFNDFSNRTVFIDAEIYRTADLILIKTSPKLIMNMSLVNRARVSFSSRSYVMTVLNFLRSCLCLSRTMTMSIPLHPPNATATTFIGPTPCPLPPSSTPVSKLMNFHCHLYQRNRTYHLCV